jgi:hypothetical protein
MVGVVNWINLAQDRHRQTAGSCERGNEPVGSWLFKRRPYCFLFKKNFAPWNELFN